MAKKDKSRRLPSSIKKMITMAKVPLKLATHVMTVGGIIVATIPVHRGIDQAFHGDFTGAGISLKQDTIAAGTGTPTFKDAATQLVVGVGLPLLAGSILIYGGGVLRKRIGN